MSVIDIRNFRDRAERVKELIEAVTHISYRFIHQEHRGYGPRPSDEDYEEQLEDHYKDTYRELVRLDLPRKEISIALKGLLPTTRLIAEVGAPYYERDIDYSVILTELFKDYLSRKITIETIDQDLLDHAITIAERLEEVAAGIYEKHYQGRYQVMKQIYKAALVEGCAVMNTLPKLSELSTRQLSYFVRDAAKQVSAGNSVFTADLLEGVVTLARHPLRDRKIDSYLGLTRREMDGIG